jgi:hypothetical protein
MKGEKEKRKLPVENQMRRTLGSSLTAPAAPYLLQFHFKLLYFR